ncbi:Poly [ADP-ribose] polymerase 6 [Tritrichomonas musculus]|uniref:Poly [ADP-ribose] polymerase 6 n=1 Tax=Tritrichomonas musculus TaxID=1915356 RepID=A0ABR2K3F5_9EUKA
MSEEYMQNENEFPEEENYQGDEFADDWREEEEEESSEPPFTTSIDDEGVYDPKIAIINNFKVYMFGINADLLPNGNIVVDIPRTFLPITLQVAYGFIQHDIAFNLKVDIVKGWNSPFSKAYVKHPISGEIYTGRTLVKDAILNFFKPDYKPKTYYRSAPFFFYSTTKPDDGKVNLITSNGFEINQAKRALSICRNDVEKTLLFLRTGQLDMSEHLNDSKPPCTYLDNPLIYLVLEIADSIFDLQDHCSICRCPIQPGIKPTSCNNPKCQFIFADIGAGISLVQEIKRDVLVADLLFTVFMCAKDTDFLTPAPPFNSKQLKNIVKKIPQISVVASYKNDQELCESIGADAFSLLRWVILTNRSQLFYLHPQIELPCFKNRSCFQFMALISSPEQEDIFQQLKKKYGSIFLWHGSPGERWHSIIRNGLINASHTKLMRVGAAYGEGIYFARDSSISQGYSNVSENPFKGSKLGRSFFCIALCEVINLPRQKDISEVVLVRDPETGNRVKKTIKGKFNEHDYCFTLTMEEACIVRFVIVNLQNHVNVYTNPPQNLPSLIDVLDVQAKAIVQ